MAKRKAKKRGQYEKHGDGWCVWCGDPFATNHNNARTCSPKCRSRLAAFRKWTTLEPEYPVGHVTAKTAYMELMGTLLTAEIARRQQQQNYRQNDDEYRDRSAVAAIENTNTCFGQE